MVRMVGELGICVGEIILLLITSTAVRQAYARFPLIAVVIELLKKKNITSPVFFKKTATAVAGLSTSTSSRLFSQT
ncbi:hypothetical protein FO519_009799 [Halicephalobus sp. NKZ332]|nr:hypothetical protein FO519_009799 [Halicephalobus sp. NKZ332]